MHVWVSLLTSTTLVLHLALGCAWHHPHGVDDVCVAADEHAGHSHHDHDAADPAESATPEEPTHESQCDVVSCVYIIAGKTIIEVPGLVELTLPNISDCLPTDLASHQDWQDPPRAPAAVRPHLLYQVFLI